MDNQNINTANIYPYENEEGTALNTDEAYAKKPYSNQFNPPIIVVNHFDANHKNKRPSFRGEVPDTAIYDYKNEFNNDPETETVSNYGDLCKNIKRYNDSNIVCSGDCSRNKNNEYNNRRRKSSNSRLGVRHSWYSSFLSLTKLPVTKGHFGRTSSHRSPLKNPSTPFFNHDNRPGELNVCI